MQSLSKYSLIFLTVLLLFPSAVKSVHFFAGHEHVFCHNYSDSHFHQQQTDCGLFKFHQSSFPSFETFDFTVFEPEIKTTKPISSYRFLSEFENLSFGLRGPPTSAEISS